MAIFHFFTLILIQTIQGVFPHSYDLFFLLHIITHRVPYSSLLFLSVFEEIHKDIYLLMFAYALKLLILHSLYTFSLFHTCNDEQRMKKTNHEEICKYCFFFKLHDFTEHTCIYEKIATDYKENKVKC